jgi:hypothetical protein
VPWARCSASTTANWSGWRCSWSGICPRGQGRSPEQVWLTADPSGQQLLISYGVDGGFIIGWIGHGALQRLPITQPYLPNNATLIIAW